MQVALGKMQKEYQGWASDVVIKKNCDSLLAVAREVPDPSKSITLPTGESLIKMLTLCCNVEGFALGSNKICSPTQHSLLK